MTMEEAAGYLYSIPKFTKKNGLSHTKTLLDILGDPGTKRKIVHAAGSNGKGSTCTFLESMLRHSGVSTGLFTSPHLVDVRERIRVNGALCGQGEFLEAFAEVRAAADEMTGRGLGYPSFFEFVFAMGMVIFEKNDVEYIILEAGMGGLLDDTNVIEKPVMTIITSISPEHTQYLGKTIEEIAAHKAGIIKEGVPLVYDAGNAAAAGVIEKRVKESGISAIALTKGNISDISFGKDHIDFCLDTIYDKNTSWRVESPASYQAMNAALAITAIRMMTRTLPDLAFSEEELFNGIREARVKGRMQKIREGVYFDGAHNPGALSAFAKSAGLMSEKDVLSPLLLFAMVNDKDIDGSVKALIDGCRWGAIAVTRISSERAADTGRLKKAFADAGRDVAVYEDAFRALLEMEEQRQSGQKLFCAGSLYFIGELEAAAGGQNGGKA